MTIDASLVLAITLTCGALARAILSVHAENRRLRAARRRTSALMRRVKRERDWAREDFASAIETAVEAQRELDAVEMKRRKVVPIRGKWSN